MRQTPRHFLRFSDFTYEEYLYIFKRTSSLKRKLKSFLPHQTLNGRALAMIFDKNSTRTRLSFEIGIQQLGGHGIYLNNKDTQASRGESIEDTAKVISRMADLVMIRTFKQSDIETFAKHSQVPVINGLTDELHPCQILADIYSYWEKLGSIEGRTVAWIGDGNNMANTWLEAAKTLKFKIAIASPKKYGVKPDILEKFSDVVQLNCTNPILACQNADIVTTDVWTSMGDELEKEERQQAFSQFCVTKDCMAVAKKHALFMHCLPAHRGEEVSEDVIDGPQSIVWDEAENRLHVQKSIMEFLILGKQIG